MCFSVKVFLIVIGLLQLGQNLNAQISGCTDKKAGNFNNQATINDGTCVYSETYITPKHISNLSNDVSETSGLFVHQGEVWTNNDSGGDAALYNIDAITGEVIRKVFIKNIPAIDWEDIAKDDDFVYIGDFGNNNGNRKNLRIIKFPLIELDQDTITSATIMTFNYSDQSDFTSEPENNNYDAEAFIALGDSLYIFSKSWRNLRSRIYSLPKIFNNYSAHMLDSLLPNGLVTGADFLKNEHIVVLCGYNKVLQPFIYMMWDYGNKNFTEGNHRKINLNLPLRQVEGIGIDHLKLAYFSNESLVNNLLDIPAAMYEIDLTEWIIPNEVDSSREVIVNETIKLYPNPTRDLLNIEWEAGVEIQKIEIFSVDGKYSEVWALRKQEGKFGIEISELKRGMYLMKLSGKSGIYFQRFIKN